MLKLHNVPARSANFATFLASLRPRVKDECSPGSPGSPAQLPQLSILAPKWEDSWSFAQDVNPEPGGSFHWNAAQLADSPYTFSQKTQNQSPGCRVHSNRFGTPSGKASCSLSKFEHFRHFTRSCCGLIWKKYSLVLRRSEMPAGSTLLHLPRVHSSNNLQDFLLPPFQSCCFLTAAHRTYIHR